MRTDAPPTSPRLRAETAATLAGAGLVVFATLVAHRIGGSAGFVFDDFGSVVDNPTIRSLWPPAWLFPPDGAGVGGRPLANFTFALDYARGGLDPLVFRTGNLTLHAATALALFALTLRTLRLPCPAPSGPAAIVLATTVGALWAVHPLTTAVVAYPAQRTEQLMALCALVTLYLFAGYTVRPTWPRAAVAALVCTLGMMSKEGMVVVPLLVWLYDRIFVSGSWTEAWRRHRRAHLALAATWLPLIGLMATSHLANRGVGFDGEIGAGQYLLLQSRAVLLYLRLAVWPEGLVFDRGWPVPVTLAAATPALLAVVALLAGTAVALRRWPVVGFAAAWWWLALAPTSSFVPILEQPVAENRVYLPLSGLLALGVLGLDRGLRHRWPLLLAAATVLVSTLGLLTARRTRDFRTEVELWRTTVAAQPDNARAQAHFGAALLRAGRVEDSAAASAAALQLRPQYPDAAVNLGIARLQQGRSAEAVSLLETVVRRAPRHVEARYNLGLALAHHRRDAEAIAHLEAVLHLQPQHAAAHNNLSALLLPLGRASEAAAQARSALAVAPTSPEAHYNLGNALARLGDPAGAIRAFEEALRWQPDFARAHNNLGVVHLQAGRPAEARAHFEAALRARPDYPEARRNLEALRPP